jgi:L-threonylcarbamoyladenylate synthase
MSADAEIIRVHAGNRAGAVQKAADLLRRGGLIIMPTETVYGLAAMPGRETAIYRAKERERGKKIPLLAADVEAVRKAAKPLNEAESRLANAFWPGPMTLVLATPDGDEGFRVPAHDLAAEVTRAAGGLLRVTSANVSGESPALTAEEAQRALGLEVSLVLDGGRAVGEVPSTVLRIRGRHLEILRSGAIARDAVVECLGELVDE